MSRLSSRLLAVLMLALSGVVLTQMPAHACKCVVDDSVATYAKRADSVFSGTVTSIQPASTTSGAAGVVTFTVAVDRVFKNDIPTSIRVTSPDSSAACGLGNLKTDRPYLFFGDLSGSAVRATSCGGTAAMTPQMATQAEKVLGAGKAPVSGEAPEPETEVKAERTLVDDAKPASFVRIAAPGGAVVIIGALGLMLLSRAGRKSRS